MSWACGFDSKWQRDIGYGVPAHCDYPGCDTMIHRGLDYVCGEGLRGGEYGCGLHFCYTHLSFAYTPDGRGDLPAPGGGLLPQMCDRCIERHQYPEREVEPFTPKPDASEWVVWKLTDSSWAQWRSEHPDWVRKHSGRANAHV